MGHRPGPVQPQPEPPDLIAHRLDSYHRRNTAFRETLVQALRTAGHMAWHCPSGKAGFKLMDAHPVDLVITYIVMPDQDGLEVVL